MKRTQFAVMAGGTLWSLHNKLENAKTGVSLALPVALETSSTISAVTEAFEAS